MEDKVDVVSQGRLYVKVELVAPPGDQDVREVTASTHHHPPTLISVVPSVLCNTAVVGDVCTHLIL